MKKFFTTIIASLIFAGLMTACGKSVDENKPIADVKAEAQKMDFSKLQKQIEDYKEAIVAKKADLEKIQEKLKEIPIKDMLGEKAKELKDQFSKATDSISNLNERLQVYIDQLKTTEQK